MSRKWSARQRRWWFAQQVKKGEGGKVNAVTRDASPRRGRKFLEESVSIPKPGLLTTQHPEVLLHDFEQAVGPSLRHGRQPAGMHSYASRNDYRAALQEINQAETRKYGRSRQLERQPPYAFSSHAQGGRMHFGDKWHADATSADIGRRADAFHTFAHERWHAARQSPPMKAGTIEEGLADLFAARATRTHLGTEIEGNSAYQRYFSRAKELALIHGDGNEAKGMRRLGRSRGADDLMQWLWDATRRKGVATERAKELPFEGKELDDFLRRGGKLG